MRLILATRRSPLALAQTELVAAALAAAGHETELLPLTTTGDRWSAAGTGAAPDRGLFVKELEEALLDGRAHLAVHSAKDLPGRAARRASACSRCRRARTRATCSSGCPAASTRCRRAPGSPPAARAAPPRCSPPAPTSVVVPIRGNVGTRLEKLARGDADALVLAAAGLRRLGLEPAGDEPLAVDCARPPRGRACSPWRGADGDAAARRGRAALDDPAAHACLRAERALLAGARRGVHARRSAPSASPRTAACAWRRSPAARRTRAADRVIRRAADEPEEPRAARRGRELAGVRR